MSYRYMRIIVMFDLPMISSENLKEYRKFRKHLIKSGFIMMQESVYSKLALNTTVSESVIRNVKRNKPKEGLVQILTLTEKQYARMELVVGEYSSEVLDTDERIVIL